MKILILVEGETEKAFKPILLGNYRISKQPLFRFFPHPVNP